MKYTRSKLDNIGKIISSGKAKLLDRIKGIITVEDWRKTHTKPLNELLSKLSNLFVEENLKPAFSSQRLKRMTSIVEKLRRNPQMGLGGLQDIGGIRFVFDSPSDLLKAKSVIERALFSNFDRKATISDYVTNPKESGYRSIHFVYKYKSQDPIYNDLSVELQIRTRIQHAWATAVETAELISKSPLKASLGNKDWQDFFKLVSAVFAELEGLPVNNKFSKISEKQYCEEYNKINSKFRFLEQLQGLVGAVKIVTDKSFEKGYVVIFMEYDSKRVSLNRFSNQELDQANALYSKLEGEFNPEKAATVLVSVDDIKELKEAYPSYFLDTSEFISTLEQFNTDCRLKGYI